MIVRIFTEIELDDEVLLEFVEAGKLPKDQVTDMNLGASFGRNIEMFCKQMPAVKGIGSCLVPNTLRPNILTPSGIIKI